MRIQYVFDFGCPWCFIGLARLKSVIAALPTTNFEVEFVAYDLSPDLPRDGVSLAERLRAFTGNDSSRLEKMTERVTSAGAEVGVKFRYDLQLWACHTHDAHRLVKFAAPSLRLKLVEAIFQGAFCGGRKIGVVADLAAIAEEAGIGTQRDVEKFLQTDKLAQEVRNDLKLAAALPIITIPYLTIDGLYQIQAAHLPDVTMSCVSNLL